MFDWDITPNQELIHHIISIYGENGRNWLNHLSHTIATLQKFWQLKNIIPVPNLSYHFVAKADDRHNLPVIIKIGCDNKVFKAEVNALNHFHGHGTILLLDWHEEYNALLLQQAIPGTTLKSLYPQDIEEVMDAYANTVRQIHHNSNNQLNAFPSVREWLNILDSTKSSLLPKKLFCKALEARDTLLSSVEEQRVLHGDLHLDNILCHDKEWVCIDPKGMVGEIAFEIAAFDFIDKREIDWATTDLFLKRIEALAERTHCSPQRIKNWVLVRLMLSALWSMEDRGNPTHALRLASLLP